MQTRAQRGRAVRGKSKNNMRTLYIGLGVLAVVAVAVIALVALPNRGQSVAVSTELSSFPAKGSPEAPVTVVEYADFQCPGCAYFATNLEAGITQDYVDTGKVRFIYHEMPLNQHRNAIPAAEAARCANDQGKFWDMHALLFANQQQWASQARPGPQFGVYAQQLGLDQAAFDQCVSSGKYRATIQAAQRAAFGAGIQSTPTFVIDGQTYGANDLRGAIDAALAAKGQ